MAESLRHSAASGMMWVTIQKISTQAIQFVISVLIARILMPSDYGMIAMIAIFIAIAATFMDSGFANALIQKKDVNESDYSTAFIFSVAVAVAMYVILFFASPLIADFYKTPELINVTRVASLGLVINSLCVVHNVWLTIKLKFRLQSIIVVISTIVSGTLGLISAYQGLGVWALIIQSLANNAATMLLLWFLSRWRPMAMFSMDSFRRLFSFGSKLLCSSMINTIYSNLSTLIIGRAFNSTDVGLFTRARQFALLPSATISEAVMKVCYPLLAKIQDDDERLVSAYKKLLRVPMFLLWPVLGGMLVLAEPFILCLLKEKWIHCVPLLRIMCLCVMWEPLTTINLNLLYVKGRTDLVLKLEVIKKPIGFALLIGSAFIGLQALCWGMTVYNFIAFSFNCYYTKKILDYGLAKQLRELVPIMLYTLAMMACVLLATFSIESAGWQLAVGIVTGVVVYFMLSFFCKDSSLMLLLRIMKEKLKCGGA